MRVHGQGLSINVFVCGTCFSDYARAEKKCAASPGGTFFILVPGLALSTRCPATVPRLNYAASTDSKGKLLVDGLGALQMLARESPHIVAFRSAGTTSRAAGRFLVHF